MGSDFIRVPFAAIGSMQPISSMISWLSVRTFLFHQLFWGLGIAVSPAPVCFAQLSDASRSSLSATIEAARQSLDERRLPDFEAAGTSIAQAADGVENYFRPITDSANVDKWMVYLATEPLVEAIQGNAAEDQVLQQAIKTRGRMIGNIPGLELQPVVELRDRVDAFIAASRFKDRAKAVQFVDQQLVALDQRVTQADAIPTAEQAAALAAITKVIGESNQTSTVPESLQRVFSKPNIVIAVSSSLIRRASTQVVDRQRGINDCIMGTRIVGNGRLQGLVTAQTVPSFGQAAVELTLCANFQSQNKGYNGPVSLNTTASGNVVSRRTIFISESGISLSPSTTNATLFSNIESINHPLKLVRRIASKKAAQQKPQADAIATEKFRGQVRSEFDAQIAEAVASAPSSSRQEAFATGHTMLRRLYLPEPIRTLGSTDHSIFLIATQAANDQLAAINPAPILIPDSFDLAMQLHESAVDNIASRVLAGRTMSGEQIDRLMADVGRPRSSKSTSESSNPDDLEANESFIIDFARFRPIIFEARDQTIKVGLRGTRFKQGERELKRPLEITATYRPMNLGDGSVFLERMGDVAVDFPGGGRLTISQVALRRSIQRAFDDRFPPTLLDQRLTLPETLPVASMRGQILRATSIDARDGWVSVSAR